MEATYIGIHMWKQAVEKAKSTDTDKVIAAMAGQTFKAPSRLHLKMDEKNHHLHKPVFIGESRPTASSTWCGRPRARSRPRRTSPRRSGAPTSRQAAADREGHGGRDRCRAEGAAGLLEGRG
jgi:urea transport system substrate-binding protein